MIKKKILNFFKKKKKVDFPSFPSHIGKSISDIKKSYTNPLFFSLHSLRKIDDFGYFYAIFLKISKKSAKNQQKNVKKTHYFYQKMMNFGKNMSKMNDFYQKNSEI